MAAYGGILWVCIQVDFAIGCDGFKIFENDIKKIKSMPNSLANANLFWDYVWDDIHLNEYWGPNPDDPPEVKYRKRYYSHRVFFLRGNPQTLKSININLKKWNVVSNENNDDQPLVEDRIIIVKDDEEEWWVLTLINKDKSNRFNFIYLEKAEVASYLPNEMPIFFIDQGIKGVLLEEKEKHNKTEK